MYKRFEDRGENKSFVVETILTEGPPESIGPAACYEHVERCDFRNSGICNHD